MKDFASKMLSDLTYALSCREHAMGHADSSILSVRHSAKVKIRRKESAAYSRLSVRLQEK